MFLDHLSEVNIRYENKGWYVALLCILLAAGADRHKHSSSTHSGSNHGNSASKTRQSSTRPSLDKSRSVPHHNSESNRQTSSLSKSQSSTDRQKSWTSSQQSKAVSSTASTSNLQTGRQSSSGDASRNRHDHRDNSRDRGDNLYVTGGSSSVSRITEGHYSKQDYSKGQHATPPSHRQGSNGDGLGTRPHLTGTNSSTTGLAYNSLDRGGGTGSLSRQHSSRTPGSYHNEGRVVVLLYIA